MIFMPFQPLNIFEIYTVDKIEVIEAWALFCRFLVFTNLFINQPEFFHMDVSSEQLHHII